MMDGKTGTAWIDESKLKHISIRQETLLVSLYANKINIAIFCVLVFVLARQYFTRTAKGGTTSAEPRFLDAPDFPDIEGLPKFRWQDEVPIKLRKFKPKYFLTMAIENLDPSEFLVMDNTYAARLDYRSRIIKDSGHICIGVHDDPRIRLAVTELYTYLLGHYLPKRYPTMFELHQATFESGPEFMFHNTVTNQMFPVNPTKITNTQTLLSILGRVIDTDFLFLLPEKDSEDPKYKLEAYICICPSGWDPREKLGKRLASIHDPVPGYKEKLEASMDRYFKNLELGKFVRRSNWSITQHEALFMPDRNSNHGTDDSNQQSIASIDPDKTFLRCERQTLHRLPKSKALVFAFKTYMDSIRDVKHEGLGDELAAAIDGLTAGNVPAINVYKRAPVWRQAVKDYLQS